MNVIDFDRAVAGLQAKEQTSIAACLPHGKTVAEALLRAVRCRRELWQSRSDLNEDGRIDALLNFCTRLLGGDATAGQFLASAAIWA